MAAAIFWAFHNKALACTGINASRVHWQSEVPTVLRPYARVRGASPPANGTNSLCEHNAAIMIRRDVPDSTPVYIQGVHLQTVVHSDPNLARPIRNVVSRWQALAKMMNFPQSAMRDAKWRTGAPAVRIEKCPAHQNHLQRLRMKLQPSDSLASRA